MNFERPVVFFDLETTGLDINNDRIVQMSCVKVVERYDNRKILVHQLINPGIPINPEAIEMHKITDEMVKDCPGFDKMAADVLEQIKGCDLAGYNCLRFDVPMLYNEFKRAGIDWDFRRHKIIDVCNIFMLNEKRDLQSAVRFYCGKEFEDAHDALNDVQATIDVFMAQIDRYPEMPKTAKELELYCNRGNEILDLSGKFKYDKDGNIVFSFGQYRNKPAAEHEDHLHWMLNADFPHDTKDLIERILNGESSHPVIESEPVNADDPVNDDDLPF